MHFLFLQESNVAAGVKVARIYKIHIDAANVIYQRVTAREGKGKGKIASQRKSEWVRRRGVERECKGLVEELGSA